MEKKELIGKTKKVAMGVARNPLCNEFYRKCIVRKVGALNNDSITIKAVKQTLEDILLIAEKIEKGETS